MIELLGMIGSVVILVSFMFKKEKTIRTVNGIGSLIYIVYGTLIKAPSVIVLNIAMVLVQLYYLKKGVD